MIEGFGSTRPRDGHCRDVLVIDDSPANLQLIAARLGRLGFRATRATGGTAGLELLARRRFDLVLLDAAMPGLSGIETLARLRADRGTPVLMMTARGDRAGAAAAIEAGADEVITKPFDGDQLAGAIDRLLARCGMIAALGGARASGLVPSQAAAG